MSVITYSKRDRVQLPSLDKALDQQFDREIVG
jgi:hypothetical protein